MRGSRLPFTRVESAAREAIEFHLECLVAEGAAIPEEGSLEVEHVEVA